MLLPNELFFKEVEAMIDDGLPVRIRMRGHSMRPLLREERDIVVLQRCDVSELKRGDIVLFRYRGQHILHRILHVEADRFVLVGDGNYRTRESCSPQEIVARAVQVIRPSGRTISCDSSRWRRQSRLWLGIPEWLRRQILRVLWHLGIR